MSANYSLTFSNSNYVNNKKISNNVVKSKIISTLKKAEKVLTDEKFKKLQSDLIINLKNNNIVVANIKNNNYKLDIIGGDISPNLSNKQNPYKKNYNTLPPSKELTESKPSIKVPIVQPIPHSNQKDELHSEINEITDSPVQSITHSDTQSVTSDTVTVKPIPYSNQKDELHSEIDEITGSPVQSITHSDTQSVTGTAESNSENHTQPVTSDTVTVKPIPHSNQKDKLHNDTDEITGSPVQSITPSDTESIKSDTETDSPQIIDHSPQVEKKKTIVNHIKGFFGFKGGNNNNDSSESSTEESLSEDSSSEESLDTQTYFFDEHESDEESILDKMKDKKYLNNLNVKDLRSISKTNNLILTKGGSYLKKEQLVKQIQKKFKNK